MGGWVGSRAVPTHPNRPASLRFAPWLARGLSLLAVLPATLRCLQVVSAGADATVRVWDAKTCDCTFVFRPPQASATAEAPVVGVALNPQNVDQVLVATRSPSLYLMTLQGQVGGPLRGMWLGRMVPVCAAYAAPV